MGANQRSMLSIMWVVALVAISMVPVRSAIARQNSPQASEQESDTEAVDPVEVFTPDFDDQDLVETSVRAWEYRPYAVAVWFCLDGSTGVNSVYQQVAHDVTRRSELLDPSGWDLTTGLAPSRWRNRFLKHIDQPEKCVGVDSLSALENYDKLMLVCLKEEAGKTNVRVREYDIQTQQWGPLVLRDVAQKHRLGAGVMDAISIAFMPLARIDRVQELTETNEEGELRKVDEVVMQIRAVRSCLRTTIDSEMNWNAGEIVNSPVFVREDDRFMPIIRTTDKKGNLARLDPIEFTFLTVNSRDGAVLRASIESSQRAPLSQRKSKRAQKLALVIRPPERSTKLYLVSNDKKRTPMEGFEVFAGRPGGSLRGEKPVLLGKTDWRGSIDVPPTADGLRIVLVRRGSRGLRRLPIIPGLYESVLSTLPNDETRLYAEGVIQGFQNEILSMVIQREVLEGDTEKAIENKNVDLALESFNALKALSIRDVKAKMNDEEVRLKSLTPNAGELGFIIARFGALKKILNEQESKSKESALQEVIQDIRESRISNSTN